MDNRISERTTGDRNEKCSDWGKIEQRAGWNTFHLRLEKAQATESGTIPSTNAAEMSRGPVVIPPQSSRNRATSSACDPICGPAQSCFILVGAGAFIGYIYPATHFLTICRNIFSKGLGFPELHTSILAFLRAVPVLTIAGVFLLKKQGV